MPQDVQSNGLLSQLVGIKAQKQAQDKLNAIQTYKMILDPDSSASEGMRQYAGNSMLDLIGQEFGGGGGGKGGSGKGGSGGGGKNGAGNPIVDLFKHVIGKSVSAGSQKQQQEQQPQPQQSTDDPGAPGGAGPGGSQTAKAAPEPRFLTREQMDAQKAATQSKIDAARVKLAQDTEAAKNKADQESMVDNATGVRMAREADLKEAGIGKDDPRYQQYLLYGDKAASLQKPGTAGKPSKQFVQLPDGSTHLAWVTPGQPGGTLADTGEPLPEGWTPAAPPSGADARTTYAQLLRSLHDKYPQLGKDQIATMAGEEYQKKYGVEIGKAEQAIAINQVLSGVGGGDYTPPVPSGAGALGEKPKLTPKPNAPPASSRVSPEDSINRSVYMSNLLGNSKATGPERVRDIKGRESFKKQTGLDPAEFEALAASDRGTAKAVIDTVERQASVQRVNEVLNQFGDEAVKRAQEVAKNEPDAPILKKPIRELSAATVGNPALARFLLAYNGFQRQYSTLTAGAGGLSRAQLPVGIADKVDHVLDPNATLETVIQSVDQVKIEGKRELEGFDKARGDMSKMIALSMEGKGGAAGGTSGTGGGGGVSGGEDREYQGHTYHRDKAGDPWKLVK